MIDLLVRAVIKCRFGVSTHLFHSQRLSRDHLLEIAAHGFEVIEVFATRTHFDYHNPAAVADLQQWLAEAGLELYSIHAPIGESFIGGRWSGMLSIASRDGEARGRAVEEAKQALTIARRIPAKVLVAHVGCARGLQVAGDGDSRSAAKRSVEEIQESARPLDVRIALEVIPNVLSRAGSLVHFVEEDLDGADVGICLDLGHAHLDGDLVEAMELVSEHLLAVDVHDNRGRADDHLVPLEGTIDWPAAMTTMQKVGYEGALMFELTGRGSPREALGRAKKARVKLEHLLGDR
ncbi:MAG TPA: sugar phosphate isomerase/epimerase family protein [Vicinamibacterales bacterium]|jgi:sugar phosphate isomerase/epimerase|nr:sugar phosphate isomerase/epimerase family protein [Vicinamibacterales bacterium]